MGVVTVIVSFVVCLTLNVGLNTFDVFSDITLSFNTLTFNLGDSLLLSGCKSCSGKEDKDVFSVKNSSCQHCLTQNNYFACGKSFQILEKLNELSKSDTCVTDRFGVSFNETSKSYQWKNETCKDDVNTCCVEVRDNAIANNPLSLIDKRIIAYQPDGLKNLRNELGYDIFILSGTSNNYHCQRVYLDYVDWSHSNIKAFIKENITNVKKPHEIEWFYKFKQSENGKSILEKGFDVNSECGLYITNKLKKHVENNGEMCGASSCLVYIQSLKWKLNISSVNEWKEQTFFSEGVKYGGQICSLLVSLGLASLVPIVTNIVFNIFVFIEDLKSGDAKEVELIFVLLACYPQTKCLKFLFQYLMHQDEKKLDIDKNKFDSGIGSLEPFLESAFQVSLYSDFVQNVIVNVYCKKNLVMPNELATILITRVIKGRACLKLVN